MEWTANRLIPTIIAGGVAMGLLASTAVNTRPKGPPEPAWRVAAREAAYKPSNYTYVDHGPIDLSPNLPWIGTGPDGSVAAMPEDFYRSRIIPIRSADYAVREPVFRSAEAEIIKEPSDKLSPTIRDAVDEPDASQPAAEVSDEPRFKIDGPRLADQPYDDDDEADLGG